MAEKPPAPPFSALPVAPAAASGRRPGRWPWVSCFFLPSAVAERADRASWPILIGMHLIGLLMAVLLLPLLPEAWTLSAERLNAMLEWQNKESADLWLLLLLALILEPVLLLAAIVMTFWNRSDQRLGQRIACSWRRYLAGTLLLAGMAATSLLLLHLTAGTVSVPSRNEPMVAISCWFATWLWSVVAFSRLAGYGRAHPRSFWPPLCDACGYLMMPSAADPRPLETLSCPECGALMAGALSPETRCGTPWERRAPGVIGPLMAWLATCRLAVLRPGAFGSFLRLGSPSASPPQMIAFHGLLMLGILMLSLTLGVFMGQASAYAKQDWMDALELFFELGLVVAGILFPILFSLHLMLLGIVGLILSGWNQPRTPRPLAEGAIQIVAWQGILGPMALLIFCGACLLVFGGMVYGLGDLMAPWLGRNDLELWLPIMLAYLALFLPALTFLLWLGLGLRAMSQVRFANR